MNRIKPFYITASANDNTPLVVEITAKAKTAFITIKGHISNWRNSSADIETQIKAVTNKGATKAELYINSGGGDVFEANEMLNLIKESFKEVTVKLGALAASAGTIFIAEFHTTAKKNTKIMIHKPSVYASGNEDQIASKLKLLKDVTADYKKMYADKMGITLQAVEDLWAKGDYWLTAKEALKKGLIDKIENTEAPIDAQTRMQLVACGAPNIPEQKPKNNIMEKLELIALLGLDTNATEEQIKAKIKENKANAEKTAALEAKAVNDSKAKKAEKIKALLDGAEKDKKIDATQRASFEALANADFDNAKAIIDSMNSITAISKQINGKKTPEASQKDWTFADYQEKDTAAFEALSQDKKDALIKAHYADQD